MSGADCLVLHVSNISSEATRDQIFQLFTYIGRIDELKLCTAPNDQDKFAYVKFDEARSVRVGQHLTNTVFIDKAIVCVPAGTDEIPDMQAGLPGATGPRLLPPHLSNTTVDDGCSGCSLIYTHDPTFDAYGVPPYPPIPASTEPEKVEEIRRTVYVGNIPKTSTGEELVEFFNTFVGEVMYIRMATGSENLPCAYAYVEFANQSSIPTALQNDGIEFEGNSLRIQHSKVAIVKPQHKTDDQALAEVNEAIKNQKEEANQPLSSTRRGQSPGQRRRTRSRSPRSRKRSRSPLDRDRRDRDRERDRDRDRDRDYRDRDRDRDRGRRDRDRSRDREMERERRGARPERNRSSSRDRDRRMKEKEREKDRDRRRRSRSRSPLKKDRKDRDRDRDRGERDRDRRERDRKEEKDKKRKRKDRDDDSTEDEEVLRERALGKKRDKDVSNQDSASN